MHSNGRLKFLFILVAVILLSYPANIAIAGTYLNSAHGNTTYGVNRTSISSLGYSRGNCTHCHEPHASINGSEPAPASGNPSNYALFYDNYVSQTDGVCYQCHTDTGSYQTGGLVNRSYSYRAGGWTSDTLNDILEAFSYASPGTSHNLDDIKTFITGRWNYTADSNPCVACHNPHAAQGDPANQPNSPKSSANRGYPISRPSQHSKDNNAWGVWGDSVGEKMSDYASGYIYQAPYRYGSTTAYEPDGSSTQDGSNLTDMVSFCTDCHNTTNTISSTTLGRNLKSIDWVTTGGESGGDKHGLNGATGGIDINAPFSGSNYGQYVLACTDCHEPHGSPNNFLIRKEVNGDLLSGTVSSGTKDYGYLCRRCHMDDNAYNGGTVNGWEYVHHNSPDRPYVQWRCWQCHGSSWSPINCSNCHFHGADDSWAGSVATGRRTF